MCKLAALCNIKWIGNHLLHDMFTSCSFCNVVVFLIWCSSDELKDGQTARFSVEFPTSTTLMSTVWSKSMVALSNQGLYYKPKGCRHHVVKLKRISRYATQTAQSAQWRAGSNSMRSSMHPSAIRPRSSALQFSPSLKRQVMTHSQNSQANLKNITANLKHNLRKMYV